MLPMSQLIENCDHWHLCELADRWDGSIVSVAVLRRDLVRLSHRPFASSSGRSLTSNLEGEINCNFARNM